MISSCISYKLETGEIVGVMTAPQEVIAIASSLARDGEGAIVLSGHVSHEIGKSEYVSNGILLNRPSMKIEIVDLILKNLPQNAALIIDDVEYKLGNETEVSLELDKGSYNVKVVCFPYVSFEAIITK